MPEFVQIPQLIHLGRDWWMLESDLIVSWGGGDNDVVPCHMVTDGPSIPQVLRAVVPWRSILLSALWHDWKRSLTGPDGKPLRSNFAVDGEFFDLIRHEMTYRHRYSPFKAWWTAVVCYLAVRFGTYSNFSAVPPEWVQQRANNIIENQET